MALVDLLLSWISAQLRFGCGDEATGKEQEHECDIA